MINRGYLAAVATLEFLYNRYKIDELAAILGAMMLTNDAGPMDPAMASDWHRAVSETGESVEALVVFLETHRRRLTPPPPDFSDFVDAISSQGTEEADAAKDRWTIARTE